MNVSAKTFSDFELINNLETGRDMDQTIRYLYREHFEFLSRYILNNNGKMEDAEDIFQEVIVSFINLVKAGKFRGESSIKTFLFALNRNLWLNELKRKGRAQAREEKYEKLNDRSEAAVDLAIENREVTGQLMKTMDELGEACKKILLLFYYENRSMKEILGVMHYENEQVVRNKKHKCLKKLEGMIHNNQSLYQQLKTFLNG